MKSERYFITENIEFTSRCRDIWRLKNINQMKALLEGLGVLTVHVKGHSDHHQKQEITIQSVSFCKGKFHKGSKSHESCAAKGIPEHCTTVQFEKEMKRF